RVAGDVDGGSGGERLRFREQEERGGQHHERENRDLHAPRDGAHGGPCAPHDSPAPPIARRTLKLLVHPWNGLPTGGMESAAEGLYRTARFDGPRGWPSPVNGEGLKIPSLRCSQVRILPHASLRRLALQ